jgi:ribokinase
MSKSKVLIIGSIGLDDVTTPFGSVSNVVGGSAIFASLASSIFTKTSVMGVIGNDFPKEKLEVFKNKKIDTSAISISSKPTMRWKAHYGIDINVAHTDSFEANSLDDLPSTVPKFHQGIENVLIGAFNPAQQLSLFNSFTKKPKLVVSDTIEHSIRANKNGVLEMVNKADIALMNDGEARLLFETNNLGLAAHEILKRNSDYAIIKKGEDGVVMFSKKKHFACVGYPLEVVKDPTGCGDSFAGALLGYLASSEDLSEKNMRKALVTASAVASFNAESFSFERLAEVTKKDVKSRVKEFKEFVKF